LLGKKKGIVKKNRESHEIWSDKKIENTKKKCEKKKRNNLRYFCRNRKRRAKRNQRMVIKKSKMNLKNLKK